MFTTSSDGALVACYYPLTNTIELNSVPVDRRVNDWFSFTIQFVIISVNFRQLSLLAECIQSGMARKS